MANEAVWVDGATLDICTAVGSGSTLIANGGFRECSDDDRRLADNPGYGFGRFEIDLAAGGFSAAPTAGARINIHEQKINSNDVDGPDVDANNTAGLIGSISVNPVDDQKFLVSDPLPLNRTGGKYWLEWVDGGAGTASIDAGIAVRLIPTTIGPAA
jgi:hypothetical protein